MLDRLISSADATGKSRTSFRCLLLWCLCVNATAADDCAPAGKLTEVTVSHVYDGDTVRLDNNEKIRLIGLNTPEVTTRNKAGEPLGMAARTALRQRLTGQKVYLESDNLDYDRYRRRLAHVFLYNRKNVTAWMIAGGYGYAVTIPPNLKHRNCYQAAEQEARRKKAGIWQHSYFEPRQAGSVQTTGFMRVQGCVQRTHEAKNAVSLRLAERFVLRVNRRDLETYLGRMFERLQSVTAPPCLCVRGWVYNDRRFKEKALLVQHPDAIELFCQ